MELDGLLLARQLTGSVTYTYLLATTAIALCAGYLFLSVHQLRKKFPPGPLPLPIIGNLHQVVWHGSIITFLDRMRQEYGDIYTIVLAGSPRVIINGYDLFYDLLVKRGDITSNRTLTAIPEEFIQLNQENPGIIFGEYPVWKEQRKFSMTVLRGQGMGKMALEPSIIDEIGYYLDILAQHENKPYDFGPSIHLAVSNVISAIAFGSRFNYDDSEFQTLVEGVRVSMAANLQAAITNNIPLIRWLPGDLTKKNLISRIAAHNERVMHEHILAHREFLDPNHPNSFIDHYLLHMSEMVKRQELGSNDGPERKGDICRKKPRTQGHSFTEGNLQRVVIQLFFAGTETTSSVLRWALLHMALSMEVQEKIHKELDAIIGRDRIPSFNDKLPYVQATIKESLRIANVAPTALPHSADSSIEIRGRTIPAGAEIMLNMSSVLYDEKYFPDPITFRPERFLENPKLDTTAFIPFGIGRRACLGESLAKMELVLFFTSIMQRYEVHVPPGVKLSTEGIASTTHAPKPYSIIFKPR